MLYKKHVVFQIDMFFLLLIIRYFVESVAVTVHVVFVKRLYYW